MASHVYIIKVYGYSCTYYVGRTAGEMLESMAYRFDSEDEARRAAQARYNRNEIGNWEIKRLPVRR